jgi:general secretion pathway protein K
LTIENSKISQRGNAIVVALFVMSLAAAASVAMLTRLSVDIRRTELLIQTQSANLYAEGSVLWAIDQLNNNWKQRSPNHITDSIPIKSLPTTVNGFTISSSIEDAQGYFNINTLTSPLASESFLRLLQNLDPKLNPNQAKEIVTAIQDWITIGSNQNEYAEYYRKLNPPYRAAHRPMFSISELRLVKGVSAELYRLLIPYVTAIPSLEGMPAADTINVNNASAPVLQSLSPSLTTEGAETIVTYRQHSPFASINDFLKFEVVVNNSMDTKKITVESNYFLLTTDVKVGHQDFILYTMLVRINNGPEIQTVPIWQMKGTL